MKLDTGVLFPRGTEQGVVIRPITTQRDLHACVALQQRTWGDGFGEVVPRSILKIASRLGGVVAGAFAADNTLLGFVFGITGLERGAVVHWSHMLAVAPEVQNRGIGRALKAHQRAEMAAIGASVIYWTFDPLVARNAHLNFNVLGVRAVEYVEDMYGESSSPLHRGIGTDRLVVAWPVLDADLQVRREEAKRRTRVSASRLLRLAVPADVEALQQSDMAAAIAWREASRRQFQKAFREGYSVDGFELDSVDGRGWYLLSR